MEKTNAVAGDNDNNNVNYLRRVFKWILYSLNILQSKNLQID